MRMSDVKTDTWNTGEKRKDLVKEILKDPRKGDQRAENNQVTVVSSQSREESILRGARKENENVSNRARTNRTIGLVP